MNNPFKQFSSGDTRLFKGGGGGSTQVVQAAPTPTPPVTQTMSDVTQASRQARRDAKKRKGLASTIFAGETGAQGQGMINKTLLG